jgi:hypothetical protein
LPHWTKGRDDAPADPLLHRAPLSLATVLAGISPADQVVVAVRTTADKSLDLDHIKRELERGDLSDIQLRKIAETLLGEAKRLEHILKNPEEYSH